MRKLMRLSADNSGASALEFALVLPVFVMMVFGTIQLGLAYYFAGSVQFALERTARMTMVDQDMSAGQVQTAFANELSAFTNQNISITYTVDNGGPVPIAELSATYVHEFVVPLVPAFDLEFDVETRVPLSP
jgi:Flp pilus assembly protein TadG